jgi:hypothetical protein
VVTLQSLEQGIVVGRRACSATSIEGSGASDGLVQQPLRCDIPSGSRRIRGRPFLSSVSPLRGKPSIANLWTEAADALRSFFHGRPMAEERHDEVRGK